MAERDRRRALPDTEWALILQGNRLRTGRTLGRTIYVETGSGNPDHDLVIGIVDSPLIAEYIVEAVNRLQKQADGAQR